MNEILDADWAAERRIVGNWLNLETCMGIYDYLISERWRKEPLTFQDGKIDIENNSHDVIGQVDFVKLSEDSESNLPLLSVRYVPKLTCAFEDYPAQPSTPNMYIYYQYRIDYVQTGWMAKFIRVNPKSEDRIGGSLFLTERRNLMTLLNSLDPLAQNMMGDFERDVVASGLRSLLPGRHRRKRQKRAG